MQTHRQIPSISDFIQKLKTGDQEAKTMETCGATAFQEYDKCPHYHKLGYYYNHIYKDLNNQVSHIQCKCHVLSKIKTRITLKTGRVVFT